MGAGLVETEGGVSASERSLHCQVETLNTGGTHFFFGVFWKSSINDVVT